MSSANCWWDCSIWCECNFAHPNGLAPQWARSFATPRFLQFCDLSTNSRLHRFDHPIWYRSFIMVIVYHPVNGCDYHDLSNNIFISSSPLSMWCCCGILSFTWLTTGAFLSFFFFFKRTTTFEAALALHMHQFVIFLQWYHPLLSSDPYSSSINKSSLFAYLEDFNTLASILLLP